MWKVKRMDTARIVVLTTADGARGIAAYLASRSDNKPLPAEPIGQSSALDAPVAKDEPVTAALLPTGIRVPSLTRTLK
jgi:pilus assembly protein CpaB